MARPAPARLSPRSAPGPTPRGAARSSESLLLTAERLYAERGLDGVSLREIAREANQKNNSALLYHFGSKEALIDAIIRFRMREVDALRNEHLDACERQGRSDLRAAVEALVLPLAHGLIAPQPSNHYNRFLANAQIHPDIDLAAHASADAQRGFRRVLARLERALPHLPPALLRQRHLTAISLVTFSLADFERLKARRARSRRRFDLERAIENLIDMIVGALSAEVSAPVLARLRDAPRSPSPDA